MKKPFKIFTTAVLLAMLALPLFAEEAEIQAEGTPQRKLQRGFLNVALSPIEISNELAKEVRNDTFPPSWVAGLGRGAVYTVGRALVGVYEVVTFPLPYPANNKPDLQPEFTWQHLPEESASKKN
jgi:putative exosortase-associated protein (TIGR04073 family)